MSNAANSAPAPAPRISTSISLPSALHVQARQRASEQGHGTLSAYVRDLILRDLAREPEPVAA